MRFKRWLFLVHRWMGTALCVFFCMWFISGVVMMYVGYPKLTASERLAHLPPLGSGAELLDPSQALRTAGVAGPLKSLRLSAARAGRPVYLAVTADDGTSDAKGSEAERTQVIDAITGRVLPHAGAVEALSSALAYAGADAATGARYLGLVQEDAFTHSRALDPHRPLHEVQLADDTGTVVYVSSLTGEVILDASRTERQWNYVGAWIHWLYPFRGNLFDRHWADIVIWISLAGVILALTGTVVGILRWRFSQPYRSGSRSPYLRRTMRWHHVSGLLFAGVTLTWIFSGLMSMNPWGIFDGGHPAPRTAGLMAPQTFLPAPKDAAPGALLSSGADVRELRWVPVLGWLTVQAWGPTGRPRILDSRDGAERPIDEEALRQAIAAVFDAPRVRIDRQDAYDFHYYARAPHTMTGGNDRPLPVLRAVFGDHDATWVYIDPQTGTIVARSHRAGRAGRWLFALLHSWDWLPLLDRRPAWDALLLAFSLGGCLLSFTGIVIGWRRVGLKLKTGSRPCTQGGSTTKQGMQTRA